MLWLVLPSKHRGHLCSMHFTLPPVQWTHIRELWSRRCLSLENSSDDWRKVPRMLKSTQNAPQGAQLEQSKLCVVWFCIRRFVEPLTYSLLGRKIKMTCVLNKCRLIHNLMYSCQETNFVFYCYYHRLNYVTITYSKIYFFLVQGRMISLNKQGTFMQETTVCPAWNQKTTVCCFILLNIVMSCT